MRRSMAGLEGLGSWSCHLEAGQLKKQFHKGAILFAGEPVGEAVQDGVESGLLIAGAELWIELPGFTRLRLQLD